MTKTETQDMKTPPTLKWETDVHLVTHPLMLATFAKLFLITGLIMGGLLSFILAVTGEARGIVPMLEMTAMLVVGLAVLSGLVSLVVFRNRMHMRFSLDAEAAQAEVIDTRAKTANKIAVVAGILTGRPGLAGAGLIAQSSSQQKAVWNAIARARYHPAWRTVSLSNGWRTVLNLFCTRENYDAVAAAVREALAARKIKARPKNPLPRLLLRTVLVILACVPLFGLPELEDQAIFPAILILCFALASVWLIPLLAWVVLAGIAWLAALELLAASETRTSMFGSGDFKAYEVFSGDDWALIVLAALGAAYLAWLSAGLLRGRIRSGLAGDLIELEGD
jgi:hypothetical protein